jgi:hypothetical protein
MQGTGNTSLLSLCIYYLYGDTFKALTAALVYGGVHFHQSAFSSKHLFIKWLLHLVFKTVSRISVALLHPKLLMKRYSTLVYRLLVFIDDPLVSGT